MKNIYYIALFAALALWGCNDSSDDYTADDVVEWMDEILCEEYLYNTEYKALSRDLSLSYSSFLSATLTKLDPNLDYKDGSIYSYIYRYTSTKSVTRISESKYYESSFGFASMTLIDYGKYYGIGVNAVYPGSPAETAGIKRGDIILKVKDSGWLTPATISSYSSAYYFATCLTSVSSSTSYELTLASDEDNPVSVTAASIYCNPVLKSTQFGTVGYISYFSFDMAYDDELLTALAELKSAGVTDLILDMRLNGGGYVDSAKKLATAIAGDSSTGKIFANYQYNEDRGYVSDNFYGTSTVSDASRLGLTKLYCLVESPTASASELVINSLEGIDVEVYLIGGVTEGKNVAMEVHTEDFDDYTYEFAPITILLSNALGFSDYSAGFTPDYIISSWGTGGENYMDFIEDEPLIGAALEHISTGSFPTASTQPTPRSTTTSGTAGKTLYAPSRKKGNRVVSY